MQADCMHGILLEPWAIKNFGSNVEGQEESVRVPEKLEVWFGSHESGTYGFLGYDIPWADVKQAIFPRHCISRLAAI